MLKLNAFGKQTLQVYCIHSCCTLLVLQLCTLRFKIAANDLPDVYSVIKFSWPASSSGIQVIGTVVIPCLLVLENANKPISINSYAIVWRLVRQGAPHATRSL